MQESSKLILVAIVAFFLGWLFCVLINKNKKAKLSNTVKPVEEDLHKNKTIVKQEEGKYTLVFNGVVEMSRDITQEQYNTFISAFPSGVADGNVINQYSTVPNKYSAEDGYYYESVWNGTSYGAKIQIKKEEYDFFTKDNSVNQSVKIS